MALLKFEGIKTENLEPDSNKMGDIFSRIGYSFSEAIADLVDNAIDEDAKRIHIRFVFTEGMVHSVIIADDGKGMNDVELKEAMRFGSRTEKVESDLGKYGIGLKSASLSQADTVIVLSKKDEKYCGRRWTLENVKNDWTCELLDEKSIIEAYSIDYGEKKIDPTGTIVIWQRLNHLQVTPITIDKIISKTIDEIKKDLGLRFHRFIENDKLEITIDKLAFGENPTKVPIKILPLNPFSYQESGHFGFPITYSINLEGVNVNVESHIWPPKSNSPGYKLGGGNVSSRQGFYFYRNDRLIQTGGWNGIIADNSEPHLSLARVKIDLPPELDSHFKINVTKSQLTPSPAFLDKLMNSSSKGVKFEQYIAKAREAYRTNVDPKPTFPFIPGSDFSQNDQKQFELLLKDNSSFVYQKVTFNWKNLKDAEVFTIELKNHEIQLNKKYKSKLVEGGSDNAPVLKLLLLFLCEDVLGKTLTSEKTTSWLQKINLCLLTAMGNSDDNN